MPPREQEPPPAHSGGDWFEDAARKLLVTFFRPEEKESPHPAPGLEPGALVGDFRLVSMIGQGGMGQVWEAEQLSLGGRRVAVKFIRPERVTEKQLAYFEREARAGGRLSHPGIVSVYGYGTESGGESGTLAWIAMELVEGSWTLRDFLDAVSREGEVPRDYDRHVARFVRDLARAMHAAHEGGVIHRDLKPQNVLITPDNTPKVTDFGLARITDESALSQTGDFAGTYFYMSPEQVAARRMGIDHRTDIFSLGILLYEMLALVRPFQGDTSHQVAQQILTKDPPDLRSIRSRIPRDLMVIAGKALEKDRDRRYPTMAEAAEDLQRFLSDEPIRARPPTPIQRLGKWVRRHPARSLAGGVAAVAFTIIVLLLVRIAGQKRELELERANLVLKTAEAEESARAEKQRAVEVMRLAIAQRYEDLLARAGELWPPYPDELGEYEEWLATARELIDALPELESTRERLRRGALPPTPDGGREWSYPEDEEGSEARWWDAQLTKLIGELESLSAPGTGLLTEDGVSEEHGWSVERRRRAAQRLKEGFADGGELAARWELARPALEAAYPGLDLPVQMGLVPIGADPSSGLWEFWHVPSGEEPRRGPDGKLVMAEGSGLVFVLLPGGEFWMGAQRDPGWNQDPDAESDEQPLHRVELSAFFLSKYEITQAQWKRLTGDEPSVYRPDNTFFETAGRPTLLHPVEQVSWLDCATLLPRFGLTLPREAQWEYGARGGTSTVWWTGSDRESLRERGAANLADQAARRAGADWPEIEDWPELDDGYPIHAPVGTYAANGFGLHEVHGNVWEWCLDVWDRSFYALSAGPDPVRSPEGASERVCRGGSFYNKASDARSARRHQLVLTLVDSNVGLRPARSIER